MVAVPTLLTFTFTIFLSDETIFATELSDDEYVMSLIALLVVIENVTVSLTFFLYSFVVTDSFVFASMVLISLFEISICKVEISFTSILPSLFKS